MAVLAGGFGVPLTALRQQSGPLFSANATYAVGGNRPCPSCGTVYSDDSAFCRTCGRKRDLVVPTMTGTAQPNGAAMVAAMTPGCPFPTASGVPAAVAAMHVAPAPMIAYPSQPFEVMPARLRTLPQPALSLTPPRENSPGRYAPAPVKMLSSSSPAVVRRRPQGNFKDPLSGMEFKDMIDSDSQHAATRVMASYHNSLCSAAQNRRVAEGLPNFGEQWVGGYYDDYDDFGTGRGYGSLDKARSMAKDACGRKDPCGSKPKLLKDVCAAPQSGGIGGLFGGLFGGSSPPPKDTKQKGRKGKKSRPTSLEGHTNSLDDLSGPASLSPYQPNSRPPSRPTSRPPSPRQGASAWDDLAQDRGIGLGDGLDEFAAVPAGRDGRQKKKHELKVKKKKQKAGCCG